MSRVSAGCAASSVTDAAVERRARTDRRQRTLHSLWYGSFHPRRRQPRRSDNLSLRDLDWHPPQWLAIAMVIVLLSCVDAGLTLTLVSHGAYEVNPVMAPMVSGSALAFTVVKVGLTAGGVVVLTLLARMRAFGRIPVSLLLYVIVAGYAALILYEVRMLQGTLLTY